MINDIKRYVSFELGHVGLSFHKLHIPSVLLWSLNIKLMLQCWKPCSSAQQSMAYNSYNPFDNRVELLGVLCYISIELDFNRAGVQ